MTRELDDEDTAPNTVALAPLPRQAAPGEPREAVGGWAGRSVAGQRGGENEDRWVAVPGELYAVADGMGGHGGGAVAAAAAIDALCSAAAAGVSWWQRLLLADQAVRSGAPTGAPAAGTTLVALTVGDGLSTIVSVGDARIYRLRGDTVELLTRDHTIRGALLTAGIDADQHANPRETRWLTSYLGIGTAALTPDVVDVPTRPGDRFLLCSDGLYRRHTHASLRAALRRGSCADALDRLFRAGVTDRNGDDATAIVLDAT